MNPLENMEFLKESFSDTDLKIFHKVKENPSYVVKCGIVALSEWCQVSQPSVTRFCKKLNYEKFSDFKYDMYQYITSINLDNQKEDFSELSSSHMNIFSKTNQLLTPEYLNTIFQYINHFNHIYVSGVGESAPPGLLLEQKLRKLKYKISYVPALDLIDAINFSDENDLFIFFSVRGGYRGSPIAEFFRQKKSLKGKILLITMTDNSYFCKYSDQVVILPHLMDKNDKEISSDLAYYIFIEKLVSYLASRKNFMT